MLRNIIVDGQHFIEPWQLPQVVPRRRTVRRCNECEEDMLNVAAGERMCTTCGATLVSVERIEAPMATAATASALRTEMDEMLDLLGVGEEFRAALLQQNFERARPINKDFVSTLGKVKVNAHGTILYDVYVTVAGLQILGVLAGFSWVPPELPFVLDGAALKLASPAALEEDLIAPPYAGSACLALRGVCTFAAKAKRAAAVRCGALLCVQTAGFVFPFEMGDSAGELTEEDRGRLEGMPVVMVSAGQGELLQRLCRGGKASPFSSSSSCSSLSGSLSVCIHIVKKDRECSICQEDFLEGESVLKLPCRHLYHEVCVMRWLESHTTCPVCRKDFPSEEAPLGAGGSGAGAELGEASHVFGDMTS